VECERLQSAHEDLANFRAVHAEVVIVTFRVEVEDLIGCAGAPPGRSSCGFGLYARPAHEIQPVQSEEALDLLV
jgi:hypothetical protein